MRSPRIFKRVAAAFRGHPRLAIPLAAVLALSVVGLGWWAVRIYKVIQSSQSRPDATLVATGPAPRPNHIVTFSQGCTTSRCHADLREAKIVHAPIAHGSCDGCHAPDAGNHTYPLVRGKGELCTSCHDIAGHQTFQHRALSGDGCLACHDPHGSTSPKLLIAETTTQTCIRCHPKTDGSVQHKPYKAERCDSCHDPHGAENRLLLVGGEGKDHCRTCHATVVTSVQSGQHRDLRGDCLACHAAHASGQKSLMIAPARDVCTSCHTEIGASVSGAAVSHDPVIKGEQCITCHDPHASGNPKMLRDTQQAVCLSCHNKPVKTADGRQVQEIATALSTSPVVHGAIRSGDCSACHSIHGGSHAGLLRESTAKALQGPYDIHNYALCFACHDPSLAQTSSATLFRDGDRNLHEVHLRPGDRTRSCATCHTVHASDLPRLIAKNTNFEGSGWLMPMGFTLTEDGGRCAAACHEPLSYSRRPGGARAGNKGGAP